MKKKIKIIITLSISFILLLFIAGSYYIGIQVFNSSTQLATNEKTKDVHNKYLKENNIDFDSFKATYSFEKIDIKSSYDGHNIPADLIYENDKKKDTIIMVHGLGGNRFTNYPIAEYFIQNNYNVITYDQRSTNENTAKYTTFGYLEKYDLIDYINYAKEISPNGIIGVWGISFGGSTAIQGVAYEETQNNVDFLILDCPISSMKWMIEDQLKDMDIGIPTEYMVFCGDVVNKLKLGFSYNDANASEISKNITIPTLVINSKNDTVTPYFMGKEIFDNINNENKFLWTVDNSNHGDIFKDYKEKYYIKVSRLLETIK